MLMHTLAYRLDCNTSQHTHSYTHAHTHAYNHACHHSHTHATTHTHMHATTHTHMHATTHTHMHHARYHLHLRTEGARAFASMHQIVFNPSMLLLKPNEIN